MAIDFSLFDNDHVLGESAMRPIAPRLTRQAALLRLVGRKPTPLSPLQGAAQSQPEPVRAVHWHAGASGAAALTVAWHANHGTLRRIQLRFLGLSGWIARSLTLGP